MLEAVYNTGHTQAALFNHFLVMTRQHIQKNGHHVADDGERVVRNVATTIRSGRYSSTLCARGEEVKKLKTSC